jgi:FtsX-like permease family
MQEAKKSRHRRGKRFSVSSMITLVSWRLRQTWFLLTITTIGIIAAVIIVCAVPLFSDVMTTAGLHNTLQQDPYSSEFEVDATTQGLSTPIVQNVQGQLATMLKQNLGALAAPSQYLLQTSDFTFSSLSSQRQLSAFATSMQQAKSHLTHIQGRVPAVTSTPDRSIEVMLSSESAKLLKVKVGSTLPLTWSYFPTQSDPNVPQLAHTLSVTAHVVGIFDVSAADISYWHGESFAHLAFPVGKITQYTYKILLSDTGLLALADSIRTLTHADAIYSASYGYSLHWYYRLDVTHITINNLDNLINQTATLQSAFATQYADISPGVFRGTLDYPYLTKADLSSELLSVADTPSILENFRSRYAVSRIPVLVLTIQIIALILFFVSLMTNLLIDRQSDTLVLLRSRGASSGQIFGTLLIQSLLLGILAILIGLPLTLVTVLALARALLPKVQQDALQLITSQPLQAMQNLVIYAVSIVLIVLLTMSVSHFLIARMDILSMRREQTRSSKRPLWQRLNLDIIAGVVALVGYGISLYLTGLGSVLQGDAKALITTPLSIIAPFFLVIGCMLLFLRVFPLLLRLASHIAARGRGAVPMLAFAQVSRSPRQPLRMTMLLALSIAFTLFTLVYMATQSQHIQDIVTYQAGADFSGDISNNTSLTGNTISNANSHDPTTLIQRYSVIPGVVSASAGFIGQGTAGNAALPIVLRAVDGNTFGNTVLWSTDKDHQTANVLLKDLASRQQSAVKTLLIPTIVDTTTLRTLHLRVGSHFKLKVDNQVVDTVQCIVVGSVSHVPTVNDRTAQFGTQGFMSVGGILVDYQTYINVNLQVAKASGVSSFGQLNIPTINHIWLHSRDDAASLSSIRTSIKQPGLLLLNIVDRRALLATLNADPPYLILSGILRIGTVTALLLALVGNLLASWLTARTRLSNFAVMRALGTSPARVASILMWEQAIVYVIGLLLGIAFGALLSATVIPSLTLSDLNTNLSNAQFFDLQTAFPTPIVVPPTLPLALIVLVAIYVVALLMMVRVVSRPSLGQTLRLNED